MADLVQIVAITDDATVASLGHRGSARPGIGRLLVSWRTRRPTYVVGVDVGGTKTLGRSSVSRLAIRGIRHRRTRVDRSRSSIATRVRRRPDSLDAVDGDRDPGRAR